MLGGQGCGLAQRSWRSAPTTAVCFMQTWATSHSPSKSPTQVSTKNMVPGGEGFKPMR